MRQVLAGMVTGALLALLGCKGDPQTPEYWSKALENGKRTSDRVRIVEELRSSGNVTPAFFPMLQEQLKTQKAPEVKTALVRILGEKRDTSSVATLTEIIERGNTDTAINEMNKEIAFALGNLGEAKAVPTLLQMLKFRDIYTRIEAIAALGLLKAQDAVEPLLAIAEDDSGEPYVTKKAIIALGDIGDPRAVPALVKLMFKERSGKSFYVESSYALYQLGLPAAEALRPLVEGKAQDLVKWAQENRVIEPALYAKAAQVLGDLHDAKAENALLEKLNFQSDFLDVKLFVRMRMADALGRLRSKAAVSKLSGMLNEEEANARGEYIRALIRIGDKQAVPALVKSASVGSWDAREPAMVGAAMLGDETTVAVFEKFAKDEPALVEKECKADSNYPGCNDVAGLTKKHLDALSRLQARLQAAKECKGDTGCWAKKLTDSDAGVAERAAYELGRSGQAEHVQTLTARLTESNLDTRLAVIQAIDWLVHDSKEAAEKAKTALPALEKQIANEKGKTEFVKVNEDLRRLAVKLRRGA